MKKGYWGAIVLLLSVGLLVTIFSGSVQALGEQCIDGWTDTYCVCGHTPSSALGYGQVIIGGSPPTVISCNNMPDSACPEDFMDPGTGLTASCKSCPDPDCTVSGLLNTGFVWGYVKDSNNKPVEKATITCHPIKWNNSASLDRETTTDATGMYKSPDFITGKYYCSASKDSYDTQLLETTVNRGAVTRLDFTLVNGTCHEDCTNSYGRCNPACDGLTFGTGADAKTCSFYTDATYGNKTKQLCANRLKGTEVALGYSGDTGTFIRCCGSDPVTEVPYTKYYAKVDTSTDNSKIKNLIKVEKIAKYNDVPVRVIIAYWQP